MASPLQQKILDLESYFTSILLKQFLPAVWQLVDRSNLTTIINTLLFSKLFYCSSVWSNAADIKPLKLQAVQNFATRIICVSRKFDHVTPLLKELYWLPINSKLYLSDAVLAFKYDWLCSYLPLIDVSNTWWSKWSHNQKLPTSAYTLI